MCFGMNVAGREFLYQKVGIELEDECVPEDPLHEYYFLSLEKEE